MIYELHVGTFTPEGTFDAVIPRLAELRDLGITAIELMPVAQFPGIRSWGYDGVFPFAVQNTYGGPEGLQAAGRGLPPGGAGGHPGRDLQPLRPRGERPPRLRRLPDREVQDRLGPGGQLRRPPTATRSAPWSSTTSGCGSATTGSTASGSTRPTRSTTGARATSWPRSPRSPTPRPPGSAGRPTSSPRPTRTTPPATSGPVDRGGYGLDGHWTDDFHHAAHATLTGESNGYYQDFADGPAALAKAPIERSSSTTAATARSAAGGTGPRRPSSPATGSSPSPRTTTRSATGRSPTATPPASPPAAVRLAAGILLLAPRLPLLFMGEEYGETNPFPFFCDFRDPELIEAVREGRKKEFAYFGWKGELPDPFAASTRDSAVLSWSWSDPVRAGLRRLYRDLLRLRRDCPALRDFRHPRGPAPRRPRAPRGSWR